MIPMNKEAAIETSIELAKILCQTTGDKYAIDKSAANQIADFIETMEYRLTHDSGDTTK